MEINCFVMDNDSGYISHQSNFDSSSENLPVVIKSPIKSFWLSEDTLLERPIVFQQQWNNLNQSNTENTANMDPPTPQKNYENLQNSNISPDLFDDEDCTPEIPVESTTNVKTPLIEESIEKLDLKALRKLQNKMMGVCPPPSVTYLQITVGEMLEKIQTNQDLFCKSNKSLAVVTNNIIQDSSNWTEALKMRFHGLHYNRNKVSEEYELLCAKYAERYIGAETQSSCTIFESAPSPLKRKAIKSKWQTSSPGRRLSHLARRRITFSSANLQSSGPSIMGSRARQILVDVKKLNLLKRKSPKKSPRKTPSKSPFKVKRSTPSSSAKKRSVKRLFNDENVAPGGMNTSSVKRALFTSAPSTSGVPLISMEKKSTKRALFQSPTKNSPSKKSPFKISILDRKRKRSESDENNPPKLFRSMSNISLDNMRTSSSSSISDSHLVMNRTLSEANVSRLNTSRSEDLSDVHKKKLQWAVYESLRSQNITPTHPQFKIFASVLARVTRRFLQSSSNSRTEVRTSERMLRIARYHSFAVVKGKSVDEIVNEYLKSRAKVQKPQGYIGIEEFQARNSRECVLQDRSNIIESSNEKPDKWKSVSESRIDRIKKVISFEEMS